MKRALVVSPTPSHPADHGHRNRVRQSCAFLVGCGYAVDFVLYPMDADFADAIPDATGEMAACWGGLCCIVPPSRALHTPAAGLDHELDEWWDPALDTQLAWLMARRPYDVMWVNYAFLSRAFLHAPAACLRVLDTHDRLSGRRALFERHGARAEFFHIDEATEAAALARADIVVAIKAAEAAHFARLGARAVVTLPAALPEMRRAPAPLARPRAGPLRIGFIGADNQVNAASLRAFLARWEAWCEVWAPDAEIVVAGDICRHVTPVAGRVSTLGRVDQAGAFYRAVDVVVAPTLFSTGMKVKLAEALAWNMPLVATADACDGFSPHDAFHALPDLDAVCEALATLAAEPERLARLAAATAPVAATLQAQAAAGMAALERAFAQRRRRIAVVTDTAFDLRRTLGEERAWQAIAYLAALLPVSVLCVGHAPTGALPRHTDARRVDAHAIDAELAAEEPLAACLVSLERGLPVAPPDGVALLRDDWPALVGRRVPAGAREITLDCGTRLSATPLRYLPPALDWSAPPATRHLLLAIVESTPDAPDRASPDRASPDRAAPDRAAPDRAAPNCDAPDRAAPNCDAPNCDAPDGSPDHASDPIIAALRRVCPMRLEVLRTPCAARDAGLLAALAALPAPSAIVTVGAGPLTRELAASLADWGGAACFHLAGDDYPQLLGGRLLGNLADHIAAIGAWLRGGIPPLGSERAPDAGWSALWCRLEGRARAVTLGAHLDRVQPP